MGSEQSNIPGVDIIEKAVEVCDYWTQHSAVIFDKENASHLTVFVGEVFVNGTLWKSQTPLETNSKHLMIYRHPCIIKYLSFWQKNSKFYLAVEDVSPLSQELSKLSILQISIGLHSILKALSFLHANAGVSHNNISVSSIYVSKEGNWKLGGMEFLCKYKDLNCDYLIKTRSSRYNNALDPNEDKAFQNNLNRKDFIDIYAFGVLASDILKSSKSEYDTPSLTNFLEYCKNDLLNLDISKRPTFKSVLEHDFFNHEFITIHSFLLELPLKNDNDKLHFFQNLTHKLFEFEEEIVASQLSGLLLSRMVLLNRTAQTSLLPVLMTPRTKEEEKSTYLFSEEIFKIHLCPKLLEIFKVRDVEIRLLILTFFPKYMHTFNNEELQTKILPELLVGIKDTNDHLVSATLKTLAILVPILGSETVIGGKRAKLFNDGRPTHTVRRLSKNKNVTESLQHATTSAQLSQDTDRISLNSLGIELNNVDGLPERPRPDGEEGESSTEEVEPSTEEDLDNWEDWGINESRQITNTVEIDQYDEHSPEAVNGVSLNSGTESNRCKSKTQIPDILELDIKNQTVINDENEFNFFQDMEPVIDTSAKFFIYENKNEVSVGKELSNKLAVNIADNETNVGWEEEEDWD